MASKLAKGLLRRGLGLPRSLVTHQSSPNSTCVRSAGTIARWSFWEGQDDFGYQCVEFVGKDLVLVGFHARDGLHVARLGVDWFYGNK
jgi:hypothetical protein